MRSNILKILFLIIAVQSCATTRESKEEENENEKTWGLDISHYQTNIDWDKVEEQSPGFVFVKATEGSTIQDEKYAEHYDNARKKDILVGSYHFFSYKSTGKEQAKNFLSTAKHQRGDLPPVLDAEFTKKMPTKKVVKQELLDFVTAVYDETGCYPIIYCPHKYYTDYLQDILPKQCKLWIVDYRRQPDCDWHFWQTTEKYRVKGIKGYVDFNMFNGTKKELKKLLM